MRYVVLMYTDPEHTKAMTTEAIKAVMRKHEALGEDAKDEIVGGVGLASPEQTTLLRLSADGVETLAGPFRSGREQLSSYYEIETETEERALEIAGRILDDHVTTVELRAIHDSAPRRAWAEPA
jgi:hypothetical protein